MLYIFSAHFNHFGIMARRHLQHFENQKNEKIHWFGLILIGNFKIILSINFYIQILQFKSFLITNTATN